MGPLKDKIITLCRSVILLLSFAMAACRPSLKPQPVVYGKDACHHCHMTISDSRFGAQFITDKGKIYHFDSVNCLHGYLKANPEIQGKTFFVDSFQKDQWISDLEAHFAVHEGVRSPMGAGIFSSSSEKELKTHFPTQGILSWQELSSQLKLGQYQ